MRVPLAVDLHINKFNGAAITDKDSGITNGVVEKRGDTFYVTQRPSIDVFEDASVTVSDARGRAIYYWDGNSALYFANNDTIYKTAYGTTVGTVSSGTKKCKFLVMGTTLLFLDAENDQGFTISTGDVLTEITDTNFPPKQTPAVGLAFGGAVLNNYLFVLGENGIIYNSNVGDPTTWDALDYLEAERDPDGGQYLGKHHDNIVVYGSKTIEFFYDSANTTGSPLSRRQDISFQIGCNSGESLWEEGDRSFFIGNNFSGALGVYTIENFGIRKVSNPTIDSFLTQAIMKSNYFATGSGVTAQGHTYYLLNLYLTPSDITPYITLAYDDTTGLWGEWETTVNGLTKFPLMDWSIRTGVLPRYGEGIMFNGDMITLNDDLNPQDTLLESTYVTTGYVQTGYILTAGETGTPISLSVRTGQFDGGSNVKKTMPAIKHVSDTTPNSQDLTIKWAKENNSTFSSGVTIDTSKNQKVTRVGSFRRINFDINYAGTDPIRIEALEGNPIPGTS